MNMKEITDYYHSYYSFQQTSTDRLYSAAHMVLHLTSIQNAAQTVSTYETESKMIYPPC